MAHIRLVIGSTFLFFVTIGAAFVIELCATMSFATTPGRTNDLLLAD